MCGEGSRYGTVQNGHSGTLSIILNLASFEDRLGTDRWDFIPWGPLEATATWLEPPWFLRKEGVPKEASCDWTYCFRLFSLLPFMRDS